MLHNIYIIHICKNNFTNLLIIFEGEREQWYIRYPNHCKYKHSIFEDSVKFLRPPALIRFRCAWCISFHSIKMDALRVLSCTTWTISKKCSFLWWNVNVVPQLWYLISVKECNFDGSNTPITVISILLILKYVYSNLISFQKKIHSYTIQFIHDMQLSRIVHELGPTFLQFNGEWGFEAGMVIVVL